MYLYLFNPIDKSSSPITLHMYILFQGTSNYIHQTCLCSSLATSQQVSHNFTTKLHVQPWCWIYTHWKGLRLYHNIIVRQSIEISSVQLVFMQNIPRVYNLINKILLRQWRNSSISDNSLEWIESFVLLYRNASLIKSAENIKLMKL